MIKKEEFLPQKIKRSQRPFVPHFPVFFLSCVVAILPTSFLQADFLLDDVMPKEIQIKTGVYNLNTAQKEALESWLNQTFVLKTTPSQTTHPLSVLINIDNGQRLQLSDNSIWQIAPSDVKTAALWITPVPITIKNSSDPNYPYLLVNTLSNHSVKAKKLSY
ncbi:MAG: hypothetical protein RLZZ453_399 [Chlamydiota bacterium]|jgi:hypothetical protein